LIPVERIERSILLIRGQKVMLDRDLADLYGVETRVLNQAVRRNRERFPDDFLLELTREEIRNISQIVICSTIKHAKNVYAFTEHGVAMLSGVLSSPRAVRVNIEIIRTFVRLRQLLKSHADLSRKLAQMERSYDDQFRVVFEAIRQLMAPPDEPERPRRQIGFQVREKKKKYCRPKIAAKKE